LRVAIAASGVGNVRRGVEAWAQQLTYLLRRKRIDATLFKGGGKRGEGEVVVPCIGQNSVLWGGSHSPFFWGKRSYIQELTFSFFLSFFLKPSYDLVHTSSQVVARKLITNSVSKGRVIYYEQGYFAPKALQDFSYVQVMAPYYLDVARKKGLDTRNWFAIPSFVDASRFKPQGNSIRGQLRIPSDAFVILSVGAMEDRYKRMGYVIREVAALQQRCREKLWLIIAGQRVEETYKLVRLGRRLLKDKVVFLCDLRHEDMPWVYNSCNIFVLATLNEILGVAFLEAMACGLPAIGHRFPVTEWVIGEGGDKVNMSGHGALSTMIERYFDDQYRVEKGKRARRRVEELFSAEVVTKKVIGMYQRVLSN